MQQLAFGDHPIEVAGRGTYTTRTGRADLQAMFVKLLPEVWDWLDVPESYQAMGKTLEGLMDGEWPLHGIDRMTEQEQAKLAIPMLNALRCHYEETAVRDCWFWVAFYSRMERVFGYLCQMDPGVVWMALRNCWAAESRNRPSTAGRPWGSGMHMIQEGQMTRSTVFMSVYKGIHAWSKANQD